jgi:hypothetical protein
MTRIPSRYAQIALTYTRPLALRIGIGFLAAYLAWVLCIRDANFAVQYSMLFLGGTLAAWVGPIISAHAKEQMADSRSRLTPGFRVPTLVVAALLFVIVVFGLPWLTIHRLHELPKGFGWPEVHATLGGFLALVLSAAVLLAWMTHSQSIAFIACAVGTTLIAMNQAGRDRVSEILAGGHPIDRAVLIAASLAALVALWWRLALMHEEMSEYWKVESFNTRLRVAMTGDRYMRRAAAMETGWLAAAMRGADRLNTPLANIFAASFWRRARHWRMVVANANANWSTSLVLAAMLMIIYFLVPDHSRDTQLGLLIIIPTIISLCLPIIMTATQWPHRWFVIAGESLRPSASRAAFLREQGAAMALEVANLWLWLTIGAFLCGLIIEPKLVLSRQVAGALMLSAAAQVWLFGFNIWMLRLRRSWFLNFGAMIPSILAAVWFVFWQVNDWKDAMTRTPSPLWAGVMVIAGVSLTFDAYRRWLRTDLD